MGVTYQTEDGQNASLLKKQYLNS